MTYSLPENDYQPSALGAASLSVSGVSEVLAASTYVPASSLQPDAVCALDWDAMEEIEVTWDGETHTIEFAGTATEESEDSEGETVTQTVNVYRSGEEELSATEVEALLDAIDALTADNTGGEETEDALLSFTFRQDVAGYEELTLRLTAQDAASCIAAFNGRMRQVDRSAADELISLAKAVFDN